jgi:citrate synthase
LTAAEAARRLGVKVETVYAYVSRGLLPRAPTPRSGAGRASRFSVADVDRLASRGRRAPQATRPEGLLVETALTAVGEHEIRYRGRDAIELASELPFEQVAHILWGAPHADPRPFEAQRAAVTLAHNVQAALPETAPPLERMRVIGVVLGSTDPLRFEMGEDAIRATARTLMAGMVESLPRIGRAPVGTSLSARLWSRLGASPAKPARVRALDLALGLCADHALSPSTLAVRVAAAQRADAYAVVQTGLGALSGTLHGAASSLAEELIEEVESGVDAAQAIGARLRRGERIPGLGHGLHPGGDPRAPALLAAVPPAASNRKALRASEQLLKLASTRGLPPPNVDFALATLARACRMTPGGSEAIMAVARIAGWLAHALEEYASPTRFPTRALYVGEQR